MAVEDDIREAGIGAVLSHAGIELRHGRLPACPRCGKHTAKVWGERWRCWSTSCGAQGGPVDLALALLGLETFRRDELADWWGSGVSILPDRGTSLRSEKKGMSIAWVSHIWRTAPLRRIPWLESRGLPALRCRVLEPGAVPRARPDVREAAEHHPVLLFPLRSLVDGSIRNLQCRVAGPWKWKSRGLRWGVGVNTHGGLPLCYGRPDRCDLLLEGDMDWLTGIVLGYRALGARCADDLRTHWPDVLEARGWRPIHVPHNDDPGLRAAQELEPYCSQIWRVASDLNDEIRRTT